MKQKGGFMSGKHLRLFFTITGIVACSLAFASLAFKSQAAPAKKPTPAPVWGVQIASYGNLLGMGDDYLYRSGDPYVNVTVQKGTSGNVVVQSTIHFFIYASPQEEKWARFYNVDLLPDYSLGNAGPAGQCGFPAGYNSGGLPGCFLNFFNSEHPKPGYEHLLFYFVIGADLEDLSTFPLGVDTKWTGSGAVTVYIWNAFDPLSSTDPEPYESVTANLRSPCSDGDRGYWIKRVDANTWEIRVEQQVFSLTQFYSWEDTIIGKKGKPSYVITSYQPLAGEGELTYKIRLIKNPS
jgi:hypothetical protein